MKKPMIEVRGIGKRYYIGEREAYGRLTETVTNTLRHPIDSIRHITQEKPSVWVLKDITFDVARGEILGIIGKNAAGKSTLLKIMSSITYPTEGHIDLRGRVGSLLEVGTGFHPELTGRENIFMNGAIMGMKKKEIERKFDEIVKFAEVEKFLDTPVKRYSSGMYVRLAFAVAAHLEPEILVMDEVLAVGDAKFQKKCLGKMKSVSEDSGRTILFVSHNMNAIEQLCTRVILLDAGRLKMMSDDVRAVTKEYLFGNDNELSSAEWVNPGDHFDNPFFKPLRLSLCDVNGHPLSIPVSNNVDIYVRIEGEVIQTDPSLEIGYAIYYEGGTLLYWACHTDTVEEQWPEMKPGKNVFMSKIPKRFLNEGSYKIDLLAALHNRKWFCEPAVRCPSVVLTIQGGLSDSPHWNYVRPGALAPVTEWTVERIK